METIQTPPKEVLRYWEWQRSTKEVVDLKRKVRELRCTIDVRESRISYLEKNRKVEYRYDSYNANKVQDLEFYNILLWIALVFLIVLSVVSAIL